NAMPAFAQRMPLPPGWVSSDFAPMVRAVPLEISELFQVPPITNPSIIDIVPSPDNDAIDAGQNVVTSYDVTITAVSPGTGSKTFNIGKPPIVGGKITYSQFNTANGWLGLNAGSYTSTVTAKGPGGAATGPSSDPFTVAARSPAAPGKPTYRQ